MAVTVVGNTAAELSGKFISTAREKISHNVLTDTQVKALPSGVFELQAAVASKLLIPVWAVLISKFTSGAYTNVHSGGTSGTPYLSIQLNAGNAQGTPKGYNITAEGITVFTDFFAAAANKVMLLSRYNVLAATRGEEVPVVQTLSNATGNIVLTVNNAGDGNFTGGNGSNTLEVYVGYAELPIT